MESCRLLREEVDSVVVFIEVVGKYFVKLSVGVVGFAEFGDSSDGGEDLVEGVFETFAEGEGVVFFYY